MQEKTAQTAAKKLTARQRMERRLQIWGIILVLLVAAGWLLRPWYYSYLEKDHRETCQKARLVIEDHYYRMVQEELDAGRSEDEIDYPALLKRSVKENMDAELGDDLRCGGICRSGGVYTMTITPDDHRVSIHCDYDDHGDYAM